MIQAKTSRDCQIWPLNTLKLAPFMFDSRVIFWLSKIGAPLGVAYPALLAYSAIRIDQLFLLSKNDEDQCNQRSIKDNHPSHQSRIRLESSSLNCRFVVVGNICLIELEVQGHYFL